MTKYLIRYRDPFGTYYLPIYEVSAAEAVRRFVSCMPPDAVVVAVFVETEDWK